jgi:tRNA1(Val) A37 N6-methylase TrmN6
MQLTTLPFKKTLNKAYQKVKPTRPEIEAFKANLIRLLDRIDHEESEENVKNHLRDFLNDTYYNGKHLLNTKGRTDLVLHEDNTASSKVSILFEVKRPKNAADMVSAATPNAKALHELVLYYLRERIEHGNNDVKHLAITNIYEWYIFNAADFDRLFYQNKKLRKEYEDWKLGRKAQSTTDFFYKEVAAPFIAGLDDELTAAHFDLRQYDKPLRNADPKDDNQLIALYKIFSPQHLLKQPFANDSNSLDKGFYSELLYLLGLEEVKDGGKKLIQRCAPERRQPGSLLENAIATLESTERWRRSGGGANGDFRSLQDFGNLGPGQGKDDRIFNIALELCITWMNRILFLKLLEAQLVKYHRESIVGSSTVGSWQSGHRFLHTGLLKDFDELNELFFEVLAKLPNDRADYVQRKFQHIPYLNSSLFEISELESETLFISNLKDRFRIRPIGSTVLKDTAGKRRTDEMSILEYLFAFLDAYDFSSEGSEEIQEEGKALINASVLGLIFEKINGYRDGSFFTPGFITMYMARETVRRAVVQKFNERYGLDFDAFADLRNYAATRHKAAEVLDMNACVNSLRICDPAVGSGHFLVSVLNEIIAIKSELGILADREGNRLRDCQAKVENDELIVTTNDGQDLFEYRVAPSEAVTSSYRLTPTAGREAQRIQETLFHEKQAIIENCLFGVDINPNSVKICRLRLWIELLKHTYYKPAAAPQPPKGGVGSGATPPLGGWRAGMLETLPNIDINIKTGNSLISRFALDADLSKALKSIKYSINDYRRYVEEYHHATDKETKRGLLLLMDQIKGDFRTEITQKDPLFVKKSKAAGELLKLTTQYSLFGLTEAEDKKRKADIERLSKEIEKLDAQIQEIQDNRIYENAFEWRFEFPEVLDEEGRFVGFDVVVGNPPYIRQEELKEFKSLFQSNFTTYSGTADLYVFFVEKGFSLLSNNGIFSYIMPNKWMQTGYGKPLRSFLSERQLLSIIDFGDLQVFDEATTYPCILFGSNKKSSPQFFSTVVESLDFEFGFGEYVLNNQSSMSIDDLGDETWVISSGEEQSLLKKLNAQFHSLSESLGGEAHYGIKTGFTEAFLVDLELREKLVEADSKSSEILKPVLRGRTISKWHSNADNLWLIGTFPSLNIDIEKYPAIKEHLLTFGQDRLEQSGKPGSRKKTSGKWFETQDQIAYWQEFEKPKIMYQVFQVKPCFIYDNSL